jgi:glutaredoxin 3
MTKSSGTILDGESRPEGRGTGTEPRNPKVVMYTTSWCPYCARARELLEQKGAALQEIDVDAMPAARMEMTSRSGRSTVPQIFIGETHVGGCDDLLDLDARGGLDELLQTGVTK